MAGILYALVLLGYVQCTTWAQSLGLGNVCSNPTEYSWMYNARGQSPCEMAVNLVYVCTSDENGPSLLNIPCTCNTVTYSLANACRICTGIDQSQLPTFGDYANSFECSSTVSERFPEALPPDTPIPSWAYIPLTSSGSFDLVEAEAVAEVSSVPGSSSMSKNAPQTPTAASSGSEGHAVSSNSISTRATSPESGFVSSGTGSKDPTQSLPDMTTSHFSATASPTKETSQSSNALITIVNSATITSILRESAPTVTSFQTKTSSPSGSPEKNTKHTNSVIAGAAAAALLVLPSIGFGSFIVFRRHRRRRAASVSPFRRYASQVSIASVPLASSSVSAGSRPSSVVFHVQSIESHWVDTSLPVTRMTLNDPDDPRTYPPSLSEIAPSKIWSDSSLPPYSP